MQFKVPQDVLRPDKIVSFLTMKQLIIVTIGGGLAYSLYIILSKQYLIEIWLPPTLVIAVLTVVFAFFKFHDIPFEKLLLIFIEYKFRPRSRTWQKMKGDAVLSVFQSPIKIDANTATKQKELTAEERKKKLEEVTRLVDTQFPKQ